MERETQREGVRRGKRKGDLLHGSRGIDAPWHVHLREKKKREREFCHVDKWVIQIGLYAVMPCHV